MQGAAQHDIFAADVLDGLTAEPKRLSSKYFYDDAGSQLFRQIMELPEYYLTRAEFEVFERHAAGIYEAFADGADGFDLIELGAGDGSKTAVLIEHFLGRRADFGYAPIDISAAAVEQLTAHFRARFPALRIEPRTGDYFRILETLERTVGGRRRILMFLGSNIGNFARADAVAFFRRLRAVLNDGDLLLTGFDLQKDPRVILAAYDDAAGVTAEFNLNLLRRINRELGADFNLRGFSHYATYGPTECAARSFLISRTAQTVNIEKLGRSFRFAAWEPIFMEISQKYSPAMIDALAAESGFAVVAGFTDRREYFVDSLWRAA